MDQQTLQDIGVAAQVDSPHSARLVQVCVHSLQFLAPLSLQKLPRAARIRLRLP